MNWTPIETVVKIEATWGTYSKEMRGLVIERLATRSPNYCRAMYSVLADLHEGNWPPSRAEMVKYHEEAGNRMSDYAERIPSERRIAESTEEYVTPEVGIKMIHDIIQAIGKKNPQNID